jgi:hypothetical protein
MPDTVNVKIMPDDPGPMLVRVAVTFGVTAVTAVALVWIQRKVSSPDFFLTAKIRGLNLVSTYADSKAEFWHKVGSKATAMYLESRP